jgi:DNA (cytosine-5)-methyltransferase 1
MNELSLFTGIGGGLLGTKLLGWKAVGYVESDKYCCRVLKQRIKDGILDDAPIFHLDVREFNRRIAAKYRGVVDVITAGFPCQPFSVAGKRQGDQDERNMWPATIECIRLVRPKHLLLENVPGLLVHEYVRRIYGDLAESGYDPKWRCLSAAEVGIIARNRWWCVTSQSNGEGQLQSEGCKPHKRRWICDSVQKAFRKLSQDRALRNSNGTSNKLDRIAATSNAQVPICVATAYVLLSEEIVE